MNAVLFLLEKAHFSGNHPDSEALKHIDQVKVCFAPADPLPEPETFSEPKPEPVPEPPAPPAE